PLISRITCVWLNTYTLRAPPTPAPTIAALALILPSREFSVETVGCGWPAGQIVKYPSVPVVGTTVTLSEYARAVAGIAQLLAGMGTSRVELASITGPPTGPGASRVSATRQGVTGTNRTPDGAATLKLAVTFLGPDITNKAGFAEPVTSPLQLENAKPKFGKAES